MKLFLFKTLSNLFHPLNSMVWAVVVLVLFTPLQYLNPVALTYLVAEAILYTFLIPVGAIYLLYRFKQIQDLALRDRKDRILPLALQCVAMFVLVQVYSWQGMPAWALGFFKGGFVLLVVAFFVSMKWKISGHAAGNAALTTAAFVLYYRFPFMVPFVLPVAALVLTGWICSIRLYLGRHTLGQVAAGALVGCVSILLFS